MASIIPVKFWYFFVYLNQMDIGRACFLHSRYVSKQKKVHPNRINPVFLVTPAVFLSATGERAHLIPHVMRNVLTTIKKKSVPSMRRCNYHGDPRGIRTPVTGVRGRRPNH